MAAIAAASAGASVLLIEGISRLGNKLRLTGGGHGNVTHVGSVSDHLARIPRHGSFARNALEALDAAALRALFQDWGVPTASDEQGRVFPVSRNAHQVAAALRSRCLTLGVSFRLASPVEHIIVRNDAVVGVHVAEHEINATAVVLATGGTSYPETGSDGSGYRLAAELGHHLVALQPGLVAFRTPEGEVDRLQGISLQDVAVSLTQGGRIRGRCRGDLLFTQRGISGPAAHNLSLMADPTAADGLLAVHWLATTHLGPDEVRLIVARQPQRAWHALVFPGMPPRLERYIAGRLGLGLGTPWRALDPSGRAAALRLAETLAFRVVGTTPLERAMVTLGGLSVDEFDPATMGSRLVRGLYAAGEILDVTGESGGYNLQLAFSTGFLAGRSAAEYAMTCETNP